VAVRSARAAILANPEDFRAHDALCEASGVGNLHVATTIAPEALAKMVPARIAALPGLPDAARQAAERRDELAMTRALDEAADAGLKAFLEGLDTTDLSIDALPMRWFLERRLNIGFQIGFYGIALACSDWTVRDLSKALAVYRKSSGVDYALQLLSISPNAPE